MIPLFKEGVLLLCLSFFIYSGALLAHGTSTSRLEQLQHALSHHPNDANLYIARGRLHQERNEMRLALKDYQRAAKLKPQWPDVHYWLGLLYLEQEKYTLALKRLNQYLAQTDAAKGYVALAKLHTQQEAFRLSVNAWNEAMVRDGNPSPAMFHQRAQVLMKMETAPYSHILLAEIVMGLEAGIHQHGPIASHVTLLVNVYESNHLYAQALKTLERLPRVLQVSPKWQFKKASILALKGETFAAYQAFNHTLTTLNNLPSYKQVLPAYRAIKHAVRLSLMSL
ncbi:tetratricopeptide repeat protein [uncultured Shewanella sp.]|uniref:tetratricopeptide repeat protein n=1 Tax=uncultured Shewanella sp. TaxID=173975 RepID=UPI00262DAFD5|nr:tetratricopeptide repeat protein [uncultured Shewanella sp.]